MTPPFRTAFMYGTDLLVGDPERRLPCWVRRLAVLTFPISVPLLFGVLTVLLPLAMVEAILLGLVGIARDLWR